MSAALIRAIHFDARASEGLRKALPKGVNLEPGITVGKWRSDSTLIDSAGRKVAVELRATAELPLVRLGSVSAAKQLDEKII